MMNRKLLLLSGLSLMTLATTLHAQNVTIGARGGLTIPNLTGGKGTPLSEDYSTREATGFGVFAEFKITKLFSIQPMLEYSQQGAKKKGMQAFPTANIPELSQALEQVAQQTGGTVPQYLYANFKSTAKFNYLMLPILAKFGWDLGKTAHWRLYADVGPYVGLLLNAHQVVKANSAQQIYLDKAGTTPLTIPYVDQSTGAVTSVPVPPVTFESTSNIKDDLHKGNFGFEGNVGIAYKFKRNQVFIEGGGSYSLMKVQKYSEYGKNNLGAATVMIGYAYTL